MKKTVLTIFTITAFSIGINAQVNIPDANFKAYLVGNIAINTNGDAEIQFSEANTFFGTLDCSNLNISDLTGVEAFTGISSLKCNDNSLTSLDVSLNTNLTGLNCFSNLLTALDVTQNTSLDFLVCYNNLLTTLDVTQNVNLYNLSFQANSISTIDLSQNVNLVSFYCNDNSLSTLDLSLNTALTNMGCINNQLLTINLANGANINITAFDATGNPNLTCIQVDDAAYSTTNWTSIDATASFSIDCGLGIDENGSSNGVGLLSVVEIYPNPATSQLSIQTEEEIVAVSILDITGKTFQVELNNNSINISDLNTGIYFLQVQTEQGVSKIKFIKQ